MKKLIIFLSAIVLLFATSPVNALSISLIPSSPNVSFGDVFTVDIVISAAPEPIGDYWIDVFFDNLLLSDVTESMSTSDVFSGALGVPGTDTTAGWGVDESYALDVVHVFEVSHQQSTALAVLQPDSFVIATLYFLAEDVGTAGFSIAYTDVGGAGLFWGGSWQGLGSRIPVDETFSAIVNIAPAPVPEPASILLLGTGLAGLVCTRIRRKKK